MRLLQLPALNVRCNEGGTPGDDDDDNGQDYDDNLQGDDVDDGQDYTADDYDPSTDPGSFDNTQ